MSNTARLLNQRTGEVIVANLRLADGYFSRMRGLLFQAPLKPDQGLLITPCKQVHTHFMSYPLKLVFLDRNLTVIEVIEELKPWKLSPWVSSASQILELNASSSVNICAGDQLVIES